MPEQIPELVMDMDPAFGPSAEMFDAQVLDAEAAELEPTADPQYKENPYGAAKETRTLVKDLRAKVRTFTATSSGAEPSPHLQKARDQNNATRMSLADAETMINSFLFQGVPKLREAAKTRRAREMERVVDEIAVTMSNHTLRYVMDAKKSAAVTKAEIDAARVFTPAAEHSTVDEKGRKAIIELTNRLHVLAQSLPTIPNAPLNPAENQLRAIATLLVNGGYLRRQANGSYTLGLHGGDQAP